MSSLSKVKQLREQTGASIALCSKAIKETQGDLTLAGKLLKEWGLQIAESKAERLTNNGVIQAYIHHNFRVAAVVSLLCETDFVANNASFKRLAYEISMQVASMKPKSTKELLNQAYIRDSNITIETLIKQHISLLGENIRIGEFARLEL